jgi:serine/threonine protein kinase
MAALAPGFDFSRFDYIPELKGENLVFSSHTRRAGDRERIDETIQNLFSLISQISMPTKPQPSSRVVKEIDQFTEALAVHIAQSFDKFLPEQVKGMFPKIAEDQKLALDVERKVLNAIVLRNNPKDLKLLTPLLEKIPAKLFNDDPIFKKAGEKFVEYFIQLATSERPIDDTDLLRESVKQVFKIDPAINFIQSILNHKNFSDTTVQLLVACSKDVDLQKFALEGILLLRALCLEPFEKLEKSLFRKELNDRELMRLAQIESGYPIEKATDVEFLKDIAQVLAKTEKKFGSSDLWKKCERKVFEEFKKFLASDAVLKEKGLLNEFIVAFCEIDPKLSWLQPLLSDKELSKSVCDAFFSKLREIIEKQKEPTLEIFIPTLEQLLVKQDGKGLTLLNAVILTNFFLERETKVNLDVVKKALSTVPIEVIENNTDFKNLFEVVVYKYFSAFRKHIPSRLLPNLHPELKRFIEPFLKDPLVKAASVKKELKKLYPSPITSAFHPRGDFRKLQEIITKLSEDELKIIRVVFDEEMKEIVKDIKQLALAKDSNQDQLQAGVFSLLKIEPNLAWLFSIIGHKGASDELAERLETYIVHATKLQPLPHLNQWLDADEVLDACAAFKAAKHLKNGKILPPLLALRLACCEVTLDIIPQAVCELLGFALTQLEPSKLDDHPYVDLKKIFFAAVANLSEIQNREIALQNRDLFIDSIRYGLEIDPDGEWLKPMLEKHILECSPPSALFLSMIKTLQDVLPAHVELLSGSLADVAHIIANIPPRLDIAKENPLELQKRCQKLLFQDALGDVSQIRSLIKRHLSDESITVFREVVSEAVKAQRKVKKEPLLTLEKVVKRFDQLKSASLEEFEKAKIVDAELLQMAYFIEKEIIPIGGRVALYFDRARSELKRSILFDPKKEIILISSVPKLSVLQASGTFKKVINFLEAHQKNLLKKPEIEARGYSRRSRGEAGFKELGKDIEMLSLFKDVEQVVHLKSFCRHNFTKASVVTPRYTIAMKKIEHDGWELVRNPALIPISEKAQIIKDFIYGLHAIHQKGYVHCDIKPHNLLFTKKGKLLGVVGDLGLAFQFRKGLSQGVLKGGAYGTFVYTAPELFGTKGFTGDPFKTDSFALGVSLYEMLYGKSVPWRAQMKKARDNFEEDKIDAIQFQAERVKVAQRIKSGMDENPEYLELLRKRSTSRLDLKEGLKLIACSLLLADPAKRFSIAQAKQEIDALLAP